MRRGALDDGHTTPPSSKMTMGAVRQVTLLFAMLVVVAAKNYPSAPIWMRPGRSSFPIPQSMALSGMPAATVFYPNRALSFSGYFSGSGSPYGAQWHATRQGMPLYVNQDGSTQVAAVMSDGLDASHGYNVVDTPVSMDTSGLLIPGAPVPAQSEASTTMPFPDPEVNTIGGASEEPSTTTVAPATAAPPPHPAASEPGAATAPPTHRRRTGGRSKNPPSIPLDDDKDQSGYGTPNINAWFPFVFGGGSGSNPNRGFTDDDETRLTPNSYSPRPQNGRNGAPSGHSPVAIANSFSTGRNAMAHSVATAYGSPPPNSPAQQKQ